MITVEQLDVKRIASGLIYFPKLFYAVLAPIEVVGFTPEEWDKQTSPLYDYASQGEILYAAGQS